MTRTGKQQQDRNKRKVPFLVHHLYRFLGLKIHLPLRTVLMSHWGSSNGSGASVKDGLVEGSDNQENVRRTSDMTTMGPVAHP